MEKKTRKSNKPQNFLQYSYAQLKSLFKKDKSKGEDKERPEKETGTLKMALSVLKEARKSDKKAFLKVILSKGGEAVARALAPYVNALMFSSLQEVSNTGGAKGSTGKFGAFMALDAIRNTLGSRCSYWGRKYERKLSDTYKNTLLDTYYKDILHKPRPFFKVNSAESLNSFAHSVAEAKVSILHQAINFGLYFIVCGTATAGMAIVSPALGAGVFALAGGVAFYKRYMNAKYREPSSKRRSMAVRVGNENRDMINNASLVQSVGKETAVSKDIKRKNNHVMKSSHKVINAQDSEQSWLYRFMEWGITAGVFVVSVGEIAKTGDVGAFALISNACWQLVNSANMLAESYSNMQQLRNQVIDERKKLKTPKSLERMIGEEKLSDKDYKIEISNLRFSYPDVADVADYRAQEQNEVERGREVLHDVSLTFDKGKLITIIGESGNGKSTLLSLLRHDYDPVEGEIHIGGKEIRDIDDESLNQNISFIDQQVHFFNDTIGNNLRFYRSDITDEELVEVCEKSAFAEDMLQMTAKKDKGGNVIEENLSAEERKARLLEALECPVGRDGGALSGGQRQRLALARAFVENKPIVILDEPTTGLNQGLSFKVMQSLKDLAKEKTVIMVSHNSTEVALSDRVVIMQGGRVTGDDTPKNLIKNNSYIRNETLTENDYKSKRELYVRTIYGENLAQRSAELVAKEAGGDALTDKERSEKRKFLEQKKDVWIKVRKRAIIKEREKQGLPLPEIKKGRKEKGKDGFSPQTDEGR